jgi:DNA-binding SARP family transcriptional activator/TolB-like protein
VSTSVVVGVESKLVSARKTRKDTQRGVQIQMLGPLAVSRQGMALTLPASRKVRALAAYLALTPRAVRRSHLCELLWDVPDDPRGELRWCLSKLRRVLDEPDRHRVQTAGELISLQLDDCSIDVFEVTRATQAGIAKLDADRLKALTGMFVGEFLEGLELDRSPLFSAWVGAQRRRFRACHVALLEQWVRVLPTGSPASFEALEKWIEFAPLDCRAHELLLTALAQDGHLREGEEHVATTARIFESEGLDTSPLQDLWRKARQKQATPDVHSARSMRAAPMGTQDTLAAHASEGTHSPQADAATRDALALHPTQAAHSTQASFALPSTDQITARPCEEAGPDRTALFRRASIAIMPLVEHSAGRHDPAGLGGALAHDIITRLAKLQSLAVIAQGTVFALRERGVDAEAAGRALNVDYVASGSIRRDKRSITVMIELIETRTARIIWSEDFDCVQANTLDVLDAIGNRIVAAIASEIELVERNRAMLKSPSCLDAWEAHHRGLWHMYRFNKADNEHAQRFFRMAVKLDPSFSRAYAGLSFTHFQNAFVHRAQSREAEIDSAYAAAEQSLLVDERDPAAHWAMGRALWLRREHERCLVELDKAVELSPNFALGHYTMAFVHCQAGDPRVGIEASDLSRHLSPFDPLLFAMLATRAIGHVRLGEFNEAAHWAITASNRPNVHVHILSIAANCLGAASRFEEARSFANQIHKMQPTYRIDDFIQSFRFEPGVEGLFRKQAGRIGLR